MTSTAANHLSEPIQVHFQIANGDWSPGALKLGPLNLPLRSLVPKIGSTVSEFRSKGDSISYRVIRREFASDGRRVVLALEAVNESLPPEGWDPEHLHLRQDTSHDARPCDR